MGTPDYEAFTEALHEINVYLAKKIAGDGEGATALFEAKVIGAKTKEQAKTLAKSIVCSDLTKTAIAGHDANWGRIFCAMGYSGAQFDPEKVDLFFESRAGKIQITEDGTAIARRRRRKFFPSRKSQPLPILRWGQKKHPHGDAILHTIILKSMRTTEARR